MKYFVLLSLILLGCSENKEQIAVDINKSKESSHQKADKKIEFDYVDIINTDTTILSTGSMIYWQFNQDSSWLTFETKQKERKILNTMYDKLMGYTHLLGIQFIDEYPNYAFFIQELASGCCTPPNLIFLDKKDGREITKIESNLVIPNEELETYATFFNYDFDAVTIVDLFKNNKSVVKLTDSKISQKIKSGVYIYPHESIQNLEIRNDSVFIEMDSAGTIIKEKLEWS